MKPIIIFSIEKRTRFFAVCAETQKMPTDGTSYFDSIEELMQVPYPYKHRLGGGRSRSVYNHVIYREPISGDYEIEQLITPENNPEYFI